MQIGIKLYFNNVQQSIYFLTVIKTRNKYITGVPAYQQGSRYEGAFSPPDFRFLGENENERRKHY